MVRVLFKDLRYNSNGSATVHSWAEFSKFYARWVGLPVAFVAYIPGRDDSGLVSWDADEFTPVGAIVGHLFEDGAV